MKILIICSNLIGDTILSTGVFEYLSMKYPNARFTFVIGPTTEPLFKNFKKIERIIIVKKKKFNLHWLEVIKKTYKTEWDLIIDFRSSLISLLLSKKKSYIFKKKNNLHHVDQLTETFKFDCSKLYVYTNSQEEAEAKNIMKYRQKYFIIFPGGNWIPKIWPSENFNSLIKKIHRNNKDIKYILVGSKIEKNLYYKNLTKDLPKELFIDLFGASLTLTAAFMKKSDLFIGNDSGLMHLATSCKLLTVALFGPTNDIVYGPWGEKNIVVRTKENYKYFKKIKVKENKSYMDSIKPELLYEKIKSLGSCG